MTLVALNPLEYALPAAFADRVTETAISAARRAGAIQLHHFRNTTLRCTRLLHDVKLETDQLCEKAIIAAIHDSFPDHAILTEESGELPGSGDCTWIVDPLDGTVNFWHGLPFFCVSIACYRNGGRANEGGGHAGLPGAPVVGAVFLPFSQELFVGTPGRGAFLNGRPIRVSNDERPSDVVVTVSFGKTPEMMQRMTRRLDVLLPQVRKVRCLSWPTSRRVSWAGWSMKASSSGILLPGKSSWRKPTGFWRPRKPNRASGGCWRVRRE